MRVVSLVPSVTETLLEALRDRGRKVAILSRGYKSKAPPLWQKWWFWLNHTEEPPPRIVSDGEKVLLDSEVAGDEPYMLARNLPDLALERVVIEYLTRARACTELQIVNGTKPGNVLAALRGQDVGTIIHA